MGTRPAIDRRSSARWQDSASCRDLGTVQARRGRVSTDPWDAVDRLFFPRSETDESAEALRPLCWRCPVMAVCLNTALVTNSEGLWAATTTKQRARLLKRRDRVRCPQCASEQLFSYREDRSTLVQFCRSCGISWTSDQLAFLDGRPVEDVTAVPI